MSSFLSWAPSVIASIPTDLRSSIPNLNHKAKRAKALSLKSSFNSLRELYSVIQDESIYTSNFAHKERKCMTNRHQAVNLLNKLVMILSAHVLNSRRYIRSICVTYVVSAPFFSHR